MNKETLSNEIRTTIWTAIYKIKLRNGCKYSDFIIGVNSKIAELLDEKVNQIHEIKSINDVVCIKDKQGIIATYEGVTIVIDDDMPCIEVNIYYGDNSCKINFSDNADEDMSSRWIRLTKRTCTGCDCWGTLEWDEIIKYQCANCYVWHDKNFKYCPSCGKRMINSKEDKDGE